MDITKLLADTLLGSNTLSTLSEVSGAKKPQVQQTLAAALPVLVQSMLKNASTESGEQALSQALSDHAKDDTHDIGSFLKNVDLEDGAKILTHILGNKKGAVETDIAEKSGLTSGQTSTILAAAAPLLLSLLGNSKKDSGGLLSLLGSVLGGGGSGGGLADVLGSLLGGGGNNGGLGNILTDGLVSLLDVSADEKKPVKKTTTKTATKTPTKKTTTTKTTAKTSTKKKK